MNRVHLLGGGDAIQIGAGYLCAQKGLEHFIWPYYLRILPNHQLYLLKKFANQSDFLRGCRSQSNFNSEAFMCVNVKHPAPTKKIQFKLDICPKNYPKTSVVKGGLLGKSKLFFKVMSLKDVDSSNIKGLS